MPNYSLVINSQFNPFTYQELLAPVQEMSNYHAKLADEYDKLSSQADILEAMGANDRDKSSGTYSRYKAYSDALRNEADNLYRSGLTFESRQRLSDMRKRYNTEIVPIQNAWNKREQEAQLQMKAKMDAAARGVDLYFSREAADTDLQSYIDNPNQTFQVLNGQQLTTEVANQLKGLASQTYIDKNGNPWLGKKQISPIEYSIITQKGIDWNHYMDFVNNPDDPRFANLRGVINNTLAAHGISNYSPDIQRRALGHAIEGVSAGVGAREATLHTDPYAKDMLNFNQQMALKDRELQNSLALARAKGELGGAGAGEAGSAFSVSEYDLPLHGKDYSNARENEDAMRILGYSKQNGKLIGTGKAGITYEDKSGRHTKSYSLFSKNGKVMTRREFVSQGSSQEEKTALTKYFDKMIDAGKTLGVYGTLYSRKDLVDQYNKLAKGMEAQGVTAYGLNYEKGDWNTTSKNYPVREIKGYKNGKPVFETKTIKLNDLLNRKDSDKNDLNVSAFWSNSPGHQGIILNTTEDGKDHRYFIDASNMPERNISVARKLFEEAESNKAKGELPTARMNIEAALAALHTGLTIHNKSYDQSIVRQPSLKQQGLVGGE